MLSECECVIAVALVCHISLVSAKCRLSGAMTGQGSLKKEAVRSAFQKPVTFSKSHSEAETRSASIVFVFDFVFA